MSEIIEMGTMSSRGQICIPSNIRSNMGLVEGSKILFVLQDDALLVKKVNKQTFEQITRPLKEAAKKAGFHEEEVPGIVHNVRKKRE
jgi:antitoxin PrlF